MLYRMNPKCVCLCVTHPHGSGVCVTRAARHCAEGTSECNASTNPPSLDASTLAESSGRSGSVYLPGRTERGRMEGRKQGDARGMSQTCSWVKNSRHGLFELLCLFSEHLGYAAPHLRVHAVY